MTHEELRASLPGPEACLESLKAGTKEDVSRGYTIYQEYYQFRAEISTTEEERAAWLACLAFVENPDNREWWSI